MTVQNTIKLVDFGWPTPSDLEVTVAHSRRADVGFSFHWDPSDQAADYPKPEAVARLKHVLEGSVRQLCEVAGMRIDMTFKGNWPTNGAQLGLVAALLDVIDPLGCEVTKEMGFIGEVDMGMVMPVRGAVGIAQRYVELGAVVIMCHPENVNEIRQLGIAATTVPIRKVEELARALGGLKEASLGELVKEASPAIQDAIDRKNVLVVRQPGESEHARRAQHIARIAKKFARSLKHKEFIEVCVAHSAAGLGVYDAGRPLRAPHHSVSVGGVIGRKNQPGEVDLARHGVLLLDELEKFHPEVLQALTVADLKDVAVVVSIPSATVSPEVGAVLRALGLLA